MNVIETGIEGLVIIEPRVFEDDRGYFYECFNAQRYREHGIDCEFVQDNEAKSSYGVVRGLHYQVAPYGQAKLVRVTEGKVLDVVVDIRPESATFGQTFSVELSAENKRQFFVPSGFAHGYAVLSPTAVFSYKCGESFYEKDYEAGIHCLDPQLKIDWMVPNDSILLSEKDKAQPMFSSHKPYKSTEVEV